MKRKGWIIVLGALALIIIVVWPAAPLWAKLGLKPFCIQGSFPNLQFVPCPGYDDAPSVTPLPLPKLTGQMPMPIIVDDDGSPDGVIALLYFLRNPLFDVKAVTISGGEAHPAVFAKHISKLLAGLDRTDIPVGVGRDNPLDGNNAFPEPWREQSDAFWGVSLPNANVSTQPVLAADLIVKTLSTSTQPVMVFVSGTHTNLAEALRLDPTLVEHIGEVHIMGGAIKREGNIASDWPAIDNQVAEWNIWVDPLAAREVFTSGAPLHLTPLDATDQVYWTKADARRWADSGTPEGKLAADLLLGLMQAWSTNEALIWDLVAAADAFDPALCPPVLMSLSVQTAAGKNQGQTVITDQSPNVSVCLTPNVDQIKARVDMIFSR